MPPPQGQLRVAPTGKAEDPFAKFEQVSEEELVGVDVPPLPPESPPGEELFSAGGTFADVASLGAAPAGAAAIKTLTDALGLTQKPSVLPEAQGFGGNVAQIQQTLAEAQAGSPISAALGGIAGVAVPGLPAGQAFRGLQRGGQAATKALRAPGAVQRTAGLTAGGVGLGQLGSDLPITDVAGRGQQAITDAVVSAALGAGFEGAKSLAKSRIPGAVKEELGSLPIIRKVREFRKFVKSQEAESARSAVKSLPSKTRVDAGASLQEQIERSQSNSFNALGKITAPVLKKSGNEVVSIDRFKNAVTDRLRQLEITPGEIVDDAGNISLKGINALADPAEKVMAKQLMRVNDAVARNPTLANLDRQRKFLQSRANFNKFDRSLQEKAFGKISFAAKENFLDEVSRLGGSEQSSVISQARAAFAAKQEVFDRVSKLISKNPEQLVDRARSLFPGSVIDEVIQKTPELTPHVKEVVLNNIAKSIKAQGLTKAMDDFGRESLMRLFGAKTMDSLLKAERAISSGSASINQLSKRSSKLIEGTEIVSENAIKGVIAEINRRF